MISRIKWNTKHKILKNLVLNFSNEKEVPYKTILLAGENGIGKTTILNCINDFINKKFCNGVDSFDVFYIKPEDKKPFQFEYRLLGE